MRFSIHYFASVREHLGTASEELEAPANIKHVDDLVDYLAARGDTWHLLRDTGQVLIAVNQAVATREQLLAENDEIAFFPPMTGG